MIRDNCVLILGAGASAPYGFPTGASLKQLICNNFEARWEKFVWEKFQTSITEGYIQEQKQIAANFTNDFKKFDHESIDLFLDIYKEYADIGKIAIYLTILDIEVKNLKSSTVFDWYTQLFRLMIGSSDNYFKLSDNKLTIITFNYDRSLENYLYTTFMGFTKSITNEEKIDELKKIKIHHVYGKLADLPWQSDCRPLDYGREIWLDQLYERKDNIKTIYERTANMENFEPVMSSIEIADKIYFLGFGFAKENVEILSLSRLLISNQLVYVSDFDKRHVRIETQMRGLGIWQEHRTTIVHGGDCKRVVEDYLY